MAINTSQRLAFGTEKALASTSFDGTYQAIGTAFDVNPVIIWFDNQTDVAVPLSVDQTSTWFTLAPGETFILDLRANHGLAPNFTQDIGTQFYTNATVGASGSMRIAYVYARNV